MKALSLIQPWATLVASGNKTIETRTYRTHYRGDLLICASKTVSPEHPELSAEMFPKGVALCIVRLVDCVPMTAKQMSN